VADQNEVAVTFEFVAGVGDDTVIGSLDWSAFRHCQIDTVVLRPIRLAAEIQAMTRPRTANGTQAWLPQP
jgi:hypothetical protein